LGENASGEKLERNPERAKQWIAIYAIGSRIFIISKPNC
jgi:hypothetical protein